MASPDISGVQKAAILMLTLGADNAGRLFNMMHEDEIRMLSSTMAQLGAVAAETVENLCTDFIQNFASSGGILGSLENTESMLLKALPPDRVKQIMEEISGPAGRTMWDKLGNVNEEILANYLKNEYPQTVSVVLSMIKPDHSARVLALLPDSFAMEVVMRMLRMESIQKDVLDGVERILRAEFMSNLARASKHDAHELIAEIFNNFDRKAEARFLAGLEERNRESAEKVKSLMFTFNDLQRVSPKGMQALLRSIEKDKLPIALKGTSDAMKNLFISQLSERAGKMLRDDMAALGPVKMKDVEDAQSAITTVAKELVALGEIELNGGSDDRVVE